MSWGTKATTQKIQAIDAALERVTDVLSHIVRAHEQTATQLVALTQVAQAGEAAQTRLVTQEATLTDLTGTLNVHLTTVREVMLAQEQATAVLRATAGQVESLRLQTLGLFAEIELALQAVDHVVERSEAVRVLVQQRLQRIGVPTDTKVFTSQQRQRPEREA